MNEEQEEEEQEEEEQEEKKTGEEEEEKDEEEKENKEQEKWEGGFLFFVSLDFIFTDTITNCLQKLPKGDSDKFCHAQTWIMYFHL